MGNYLKACTTATRLKATLPQAQKEGLHGIIVITKTKRCVPILAGVKATCGGTDYLLGTASNRARNTKLVKASLDALKDILFLKEE